MTSSTVTVALMSHSRWLCTSNCPYTPFKHFPTPLFSCCTGCPAQEAGRRGAEAAATRGGREASPGRGEEEERGREEEKAGIGKIDVLLSVC